MNGGDMVRACGTYRVGEKRLQALVGNLKELNHLDDVREDGG
jgi:hypothetical protein